MQKYDLSDITFLIPVRIDTKEREENLVMVTNFLVENTQTNIIVLEATEHDNGLLQKVLHPNIQRIFISDSDPIFHRTKYINQLTLLAQTPFIAVWDADVIVPAEQLYESIEILRNNESAFVFPYDGRFLDTEENHRSHYLEHKNINYLKENIESMRLLYGRGACGGGFLANKQTYLSVGMENKNFYGWGLEDGERLIRWDILDLSYRRVGGAMFHFTHPRGDNSKYHSRENRRKLLQEYLRISRMSKQEMQAEIAMW